MYMYTPEQLKNLEEFVIEKYDPYEKDTWYNIEPKKAKFLKCLDYDYSTLLKLYKVNLNKRRKISLIRKKLNIKDSIGQDTVNDCLSACRILMMSQERLPLQINKHEVTRKHAINWRLQKGI
jgi:hypothetical protein